MDWRLVAVGRARPGPERALWDHYAARLRPALAVTEVADGRGGPAEAARQEAQAMLAALPPRATLVVLDGAGESPTSEGLATLLDGWRQAGRPLVFAIGGADGWHDAALARADRRLSLGPLTWPHLLVRGLLAEQLFRAQCILAGHPYHRAGRPG